MIDFNHRPTLSDQINTLIDEGIKNQARPVRNYLGASLLGKCPRYLCFYYAKTPVDPGKEISSRLYRIFHRGHEGEKWVANWFRQAGFDLRTQKKDGTQFGFCLDKQGRSQGHIDGVFVGGPDLIRYPAMWENKVLGAKTWKQLAKEKLKKACPDYYAQVAVYAAYMELTDNPAIFTALNADTMDIYIEAIPFDAQEAQSASDKAVNVIQSVEAGMLLPRPYHSEDFYICKFCDYQTRCWSLKE